MERLEVYLVNKIKTISRQQKALFISVFISGLFAHGYMFVNNFTYHDGILSIHSMGATFNLGRFILGIIEIIGKNTIGLYSVPLFHGIISLLLIAFSGMLIIEILHIEGTLSAVYIGTMMAAFPVVTSIFAFMYTSSAYWCALFFNVLAVWLLARKQTIWYALWSLGLIIIGLGIYQAYFTITIILFLLSVMVEMLKDMEMQSRKIVTRGLWYLATMGAGLVGYLILNKIAGIISGVGMSSYQGMDKMNTLDFSKLFLMIRNAYQKFIVDISWCGINETSIQKVFSLGVILLTILLIMIVIVKENGLIVNKVILITLSGILPIGLNSIYLLSSSESYSVHALMRYALVFTFIVPVIFIEKSEQLEKGSKGIIILRKKLVNVLLLFLWIIPAIYIYRDNAAYLKADFLTQQTATWFTVLEAEIKGTEGYRDDLPVVYIGEREVEDYSLTKMPYFDNITLSGFEQDIVDLVNNYAWRAFMERHCGYAPEEIWYREEYEKMDEVRQMPSYPDKGSIKVISDTVVIKFS